MGASFYGAGYGNRTRLHGLGSRCITDIRTLRDGGIIAEADGNFNLFLSNSGQGFREFKGIFSGMREKQATSQTGKIVVY